MAKEVCNNHQCDSEIEIMTNATYLNMLSFLTSKTANLTEKGLLMVIVTFFRLSPTR